MDNCAVVKVFLFQQDMWMKSVLGFITVQSVCLIFGIILLFIGLIFQFYGLDAINYENQRQDGILKNGSQFYEIWSKPDVGLYKFYLFNITNPDNVIAGEKAILEEIGPYVYDYSISKTDLREAEHDNLQFKLSFYSKFNETLSENVSEMDQITIMHYPLIASVLMVLESGQRIMNMVKSAMEKIFPTQDSPFLTASAADIFFNGIELNCSSRMYLVFSVCRQLTIKAPEMFWIDENRIHRFAFFHGRNSSSNYEYAIHTGIDDIDQRGQLRTFRNESKLNHWKNSYCNMLNGSSTANHAFPTHSNHNTKLYFFDENFGRSLYVKFVKHTDFKDLSVYRFEMDENIFATNRSENNYCYCPRIPDLYGGEETIICPTNGLVSMSLPAFAPILISMPWYLYGDPELLSVLPNGSKHTQEDFVTFVEIEPVLGIPVFAARRFQFNLLFPQVNEFPCLQQIQENVYPAIWMEILTEISGDDLEKIKSKLKTLDTAQGIIYAVLTIGLVITIGFGITLFIYNKKPSKTGIYDEKALTSTKTRKTVSTISDIISA